MPPNKSDIIWDEPKAAPSLDRESIVWDAPAPTMGQVALNAIPKGIANLANTPMAFADIIRHGLTPPFLRKPEFEPAIPNYPMQGAEAIGLVDPAKNPQTPEQRLVDAAVQGAVGFAAAPANSLGGFAKNLATGAVSTGLGQGVADYTKSPLAGTAVSLLTPLALRSIAKPEAAQANALRDATLKEGQEAGYVVPPSRVNPSFLNQKLETVAGKAAVGQEAAARNQTVTNALAAKSIRLPPNTPITEGTLKQVREAASAPYKEVAAMSPRAASALDKLKQARFEATDQWKFYQRSGDPAARKAAEALSNQAALYERVIDRTAQQAGRPDLLTDLNEARKTIAKTHDIERALNLSDANVAAPILGRALDQGKPLTGELQTIGKFQQAFPAVMREGGTVPRAGVSGTDAAAAALLATTGYGAGGSTGMLASGLPLLRGPARAAVLSKPYQRFFAQPDYSGLSAKEKMIQSLLAGRMQASAEQ